MAVAAVVGGLSTIAGTREFVSWASPYGVEPIHLAFWVFAVGSVYTVAGLYLRVRRLENRSPDIVVRSCPEDNFARLDVENVGGVGILSASAQMVENGALAGSPWPIRWRRSKEKDAELKNGEHGILDIASVARLGSAPIKIIGETTEPEIEVWVSFYTPEHYAGVGHSATDHFRVSGDESMVLEIRISSNPPLRRPYEKRWILERAYEEGSGAGMALALTGAPGV